MIWLGARKLFRTLKGNILSSIGEVVGGHATPVRHNPPPSTPSSDQTSANSTFSVLQLNANRIGNKLAELGVVIEHNKIKVAVIQESKLTSRSKTSTVRKARAVDYSSSSIDL